MEPFVPSDQPPLVQQPVLTVRQRLAGATLGAGFIALVQRLVLLILPNAALGGPPSPDELGAHPWLAAAFSGVFFFLLFVLTYQPAAKPTGLRRLVDRTARVGFLGWIAGLRHVALAQLPLALGWFLVVGLVLASLWWAAEAFYEWLYPLGLNSAHIRPPRS
jgi:lysylphosphatidylglycerol synthetase-like protein (DUF2156 family)